LSQIETGKKPGSFDAMAKLARALGVDMEDLESRGGRGLLGYDSAPSRQSPGNGAQGAGF
jgi:transcriptional regulator with XRE-family HTH domain